MLLPIIICLFVATANSMNNTTLHVLPSIYQSNTSFPAHPTHALTPNSTIFATLAAPLYHNVTPGDAWVFPSSPNDLGARGMSCECFNPDDQCCMPSSTSLAPFCMPIGSACCGDTFCVAGESCCGEFCCAASTICNLHPTNSGCCPIGALCTLPSTPTCYDHASSNCSNQAAPPLQQCCPSDAPYCRDFNPYGVGCYASSTTASSTSSVQALTAAGTGDIFATPSKGMSTSRVDMLTVTISVLPDGYGGISLELVGPAGSSIESTAAVESLESGGGVETTYVLEWPATVTATNGGGVLAVTSNNSVEGSTKTTVLPTVTGKSTALPTTTALSGSTSSALSSSSSSSKIQLCYDPNANSPPPCPSSTTPTPTPSSTPPSSGAIFNPPGATTVRSQASKLSLPPFFSLDAVRKYIKSKSEESNREEWTYPLLITSVFLLASSFFIFLGATLYLLNSIRDGAKLHDVDARKVKEALRIHGYDDAEIDIILAGPETRDDEHEHDDDDDEGAVDVGDTAQPETEIATPNTNITPITVVKGSARPLLEPRVVQKGEIRKVEGSARPWVKGKRTHSLWEEQRGRGVGMEGEGVGESGLEHVFVGAKD